MGKRSVGNVSYSEQLFQGPDFSELCEYNGHYCAKQPNKKWTDHMKRRVDKQWIQKNWMKRKLTMIKRREKAERDAQNE